jgi:hypothetical protein
MFNAAPALRGAARSRRNKTNRFMRNLFASSNGKFEI